jgi:hypothetical protein
MEKEKRVKHFSQEKCERRLYCISFFFCWIDISAMVQPMGPTPLNDADPGKKAQANKKEKGPSTRNSFRL